MSVKYSLYYSASCYFCHKVLMFLQSSGLDSGNIDSSFQLMDVSNGVNRQELIAGGGKGQVPCLRIDESEQTRWLYESDDIIAYLKDSAEK